jgi:hypothetical protein
VVGCGDEVGIKNIMVLPYFIF